MGDEYFNGLEEEDKKAVYYALLPSAIASIRAGKVTGVERDRISRLDQMITEAGAIKEDLVIYKRISGLPELRNGGSMTEPSYLFGTTDTQKAGGEDQVLLEISVPGGSQPGLELPGSGYLFHRGRMLNLEEESNGVIKAEVVGEEDINTEGGQTVAGEGSVKAVEGEEGEAPVEDEEEGKVPVEPGIKLSAGEPVDLVVPSVTAWDEAPKEYLKGRKVIITPDADSVGIKLSTGGLVNG